MATLLVITSSYPLGGVTDPAFVAPEVEALCREFDRVIFMPLLDCGEPLPIPANAELSRKLIGRMSLFHRLMRLSHKEVWQHLWADRKLIKKPRHLRYALAKSVYAFHYRDLILSLGLDMSDTLIYNFWFIAPTLGTALIDNVRCVTRAHGYDIYDDRNDFISQSCRKQTLNNLIKVYDASEAGAEYIRR